MEPDYSAGGAKILEPDYSAGGAKILGVWESMASRASRAGRQSRRVGGRASRASGMGWYDSAERRNRKIDAITGEEGLIRQRRAPQHRN